MGTAVVRKYLVDYKYGHEAALQNVALFLHNTSKNGDTILRNLVKAGGHYAGHLWLALDLLSKHLVIMSETDTERIEADALLLLSDVWFALEHQDSVRYINQEEIRKTREDFYKCAFFLVWHFYKPFR